MKPALPVHWISLILAFAPQPAGAQSAKLLLTEGLRAYQGLDFAAAAQLLRRALDPSDSAALPRPDRLRALMYLGAANLFREERDQAVATFRTLVLADPRYRPDSLVFSPKVTQVFTEILQTTKAVGLAAPPESRFVAGDGAIQVQAYPTSRQTIEVRVSSGWADPVATLFRGEIADSVTLSWNGLDSAGRPVPAGAYRLQVVSSLAPGQVLRSVSLPLDVSLPRADTLPWPAAPRPGPARWDLRLVVPGGVLGAALALPAALGAGGAKGIRIGAGISVAAASLVVGRPRPSAPDRAARAEWRARLRAAQRENQRRRGRVEMVIHSGAPEPHEGRPQ